MNKLFQILAWLGISTFFGLTVLFAYWWLYPYQVVKFNTAVFPVINENKTVARGQQMVYEVDACKYMNVTADLTKFFVDGIIYETPKSIGGIELGCHVQNIDVYVPMAIPAGTFRVKFVARYKVNPIRVVEYINYSEPFNITNP